MNAPDPVYSLGKLLLVAGGLLLVAGLVTVALSKLGGGWRLPGDILIQRKNMIIYFPVVSMLLLSVILTVLLNLISRR